MPGGPSTFTHPGPEYAGPAVWPPTGGRRGLWARGHQPRGPGPRGLGAQGAHPEPAGPGPVSPGAGAGIRHRGSGDQACGATGSGPGRVAPSPGGLRAPRAGGLGPSALDTWAKGPKARDRGICIPGARGPEAKAPGPPGPIDPNALGVKAPGSLEAPVPRPGAKGAGPRGSGLRGPGLEGPRPRVQRRAPQETYMWVTQNYRESFSDNVGQPRALLPA